MGDNKEDKVKDFAKKAMDENSLTETLTACGSNAPQALLSPWSFSLVLSLVTSFLGWGMNHSFLSPYCGPQGSGLINLDMGVPSGCTEAMLPSYFRPITLLLISLLLPLWTITQDWKFFHFTKQNVRRLEDSFYSFTSLLTLASLFTPLFIHSMSEATTSNCVSTPKEGGGVLSACENASLTSSTMIQWLLAVLTPLWLSVLFFGFLWLFSLLSESGVSAIGAQCLARLQRWPMIAKLLLLSASLGVTYALLTQRLRAPLSEVLASAFNSIFP